MYVCRVNDLFDNVVFSEWVKVKVLDIDKSGTHRSPLATVHPAWYLCCVAAMFDSSEPAVVRLALRLAGRSAHRCQPRTANSPARRKHHPPVCCVWHSRPALSVVQEWAGAATRDRRHTTGKQRLVTYLSAKSECLHSHWYQTERDNYYPHTGRVCLSDIWEQCTYDQKAVAYSHREGGSWIANLIWSIFPTCFDHIAQPDLILS